MRAFTALLAVAVAALAWLVTSQQATIVDQKRQIGATGTLQPKQKIASLELQEQCAKQAREEFRQGGWEKESMASFSNHNEKLNKCFMLVESTDTKSAPGTIWINKALSDAFERKTIGTYMWHTEKDKKYWEIQPFLCEVTTGSGEKKSCASWPNLTPF